MQITSHEGNLRLESIYRAQIPSEENKSNWTKGSFLETAALAALHLITLANIGICCYCLCQPANNSISPTLLSSDGLIRSYKAQQDRFSEYASWYTKERELAEVANEHNCWFMIAASIATYIYANSGVSETAALAQQAYRLPNIHPLDVPLPPNVFPRGAFVRRTG